MYNYEHLINLSNEELVTLARDPMRWLGQPPATDKKHDELLISELAERLYALDYMVRATLEGQEAAKEYVPRRTLRLQQQELLP